MTTLIAADGRPVYELKTTPAVLGSYDEAIDRGHTDYIAKTIPNAKLVILKDASHFAMLQDPAGYTAAIREFFKGP